MGRRTLTAALVILFCINTPASADAPNISEVGRFALGVGAGLAAHEAGHVAVGRALGGEVKFVGFRCFEDGLVSGQVEVSFATYEPWKSRAVAVSGFLASNLATEVVIRNQDWHRSAFGQGIVVESIVGNVLAIWQYYTRYVGRDGWAGNDLDQYASHGGNPHLFAAVLGGYTVYALHRIRNDTDILPILGVSVHL